MPADTPVKPKSPGQLGAEPWLAEIQAARAMVIEAQSVVASAKLAARSAQDRADKAAADLVTSQAKFAKAVGKLGAKKTDA